MAKEIDNGGPAFPVAVERTERDGGHVSTWMEHIEGMTLRDYFAGQALAGYMACASHPQAPNDKTMAQYCYNAADAMIAARGAK